MPDQKHPSPEKDLLDALLVGDSPPMRRLKDLIARVARSRANVLIVGESGSGKELVARAVHRLSPRAGAAFVAENCAALPDGIVESELFGHVRGAFTGAERDRVGLVALADGGTLFLDEIGDLGPRTQAKLLRVIQEGEYRPVGGRDVRRSDFRVIAATHRDLGAMVVKGEFREDLYWRLNVVGIRVPPLRERAEDVPLLVDHVLARLAGGGRPHGPPGGGPPPAPAGAQGPEASAPVALPAVSREALEMLIRYPWPGNVRELQNVVEAGAVLAGEGVIGVAELPERVIDHALSEPDGVYPDLNKPKERLMIELALARFHGDKAKAARHIGWNRQRLYRRMAHYGIPATFGRAGR